MIAKHISMRALKKSDFAGLLKYLLDLQNKHERVGDVHITNCQSMDAAVAAIEVLNTQSLNRRATGDKTYHLVLSFRAGEQPDAKTLQALEARICAALGYQDHQRVSVVHHDTDNLHVHIAINKIHPVRHTMFSPYNDHLTLGKVCEQLEREFGLLPDNHAARKHRADNLAGDMEQHAGVESLLGWIKRECWNELNGATSWNALHEAMAANGLRLHERGNGLVITAHNGATVKASSVDRQFSKAKLEQRFGPFQPGPDSDMGADTKKQYQRRPYQFQSDTKALFTRYQAQREQEDWGDQRAQEWAEARASKDRLIADAKRKGKFKRACIKLLACDQISKKFLFAAVSRTLKSDINHINRVYFQARQRIYLKYKRGTWADWLHAEAGQGNDAALSALRSRKGSDGGGGNTLSGQRCSKPQPQSGADSITKHGTVIICAGTTVLRDNGSKLTVTRGFDQAGLQAALRLAAERYGACLRVDGNAQFREAIAQAAASAGLSLMFDDAALEARRRELIPAATTKEKHNETGQQPRQGRPADRGIQAGGDADAGPGAGGPRRNEGQDRNRRADGAKPNVGRIGKKPPPASRDRLRRLSQLGMVRIPGGGKVLLPGDVPGHVEQQGPAADHRVRRAVPGPGRLAGEKGHASAGASATGSPRPKAGRRRTGRRPSPAGGNPWRTLRDLEPPGDSVPARQQGTSGDARGVQPDTRGTTPSLPIAQHETPASAAAAKYVFEREQRRFTYSDIPKHLAYDGFQGQAAFAGLRSVDGQQLVLLGRGNDIVVMPVDEATARRLKRLARGDKVTVAEQGVIRIKGRGR